MRRAKALQPFEKHLDIFEITNQIGDDYIIETFLGKEVQIICVAGQKLEIRIFILSDRNSRRTNVNTNPIRWLQPIKQFAGTAAKLQYAFVVPN